MPKLQETDPNNQKLTWEKKGLEVQENKSNSLIPWLALKTFYVKFKIDKHQQRIATLRH